MKEREAEEFAKKYKQLQKDNKYLLSKVEVEIEINKHLRETIKNYRIASWTLGSIIVFIPVIVAFIGVLLK